MADRSCLRVTVNMKDVGRAAAILDCAPEHFTKDEEGGGSTFEDEMPGGGYDELLDLAKAKIPFVAISGDCSGVYNAAASCSTGDGSYHEWQLDTLNEPVIRCAEIEDDPEDCRRAWRAFCWQEVEARCRVEGWEVMP